jgi:hypothetical protein
VDPQKTEVGGLLPLPDQFLVGVGWLISTGTILRSMGWCHEFGPQIAETCEHPMTAHSDRCECTICGTVCRGRFAGCGAVWERGPHEVAVNAPHLGRAETNGDPFAPSVESDRWRLPLERAATATATSSTFAVPVEHEPQPEPQPDRSLTPTIAEPAEAPVLERASALEPPDVTARYAVAQLQELNSRIEGLTGETLARTEAALAQVAGELKRLRAQREIDLTEQAAGIFGAVQTGADALTEFTKTVGEVSEYLRAILADALKTIGGTEGLAELVASSAAELNETREEFAGALGRIERDITLLRRRANAETKEAKTPKLTRLDDDQVAYIVDAVTDSVLAALERKKR